MRETERIIQEFLREYGYHAVPVSLLYDPAGVPWAWIFLMLLAEEAGKSIILMLLYGFGVMLAFDHALYWIGALGGRKLVRWIGKKRPDWRAPLKAARKNVRNKGVIAVLFGRYLPFIGRWMGLGAGLAGMNYAKFSFWDAISAAISVFGFGLVAHFVGRKTIEHPFFYQTLTMIIVGSLLLGVLGLGIGWWRKQAQNRALSGAPEVSRPNSESLLK